MKKRYRSVAATPRPSRGSIIYDEDLGNTHVPELEVIDQPPLTVKTGILDVNGDEIVYDIPQMGPIGFIHFPDQDDDEEDPSTD